jgi:nitrate reductase delta subunit
MTSLELLASFFRYPDDRYAVRAKDAAARLAIPALRTFAGTLAALSPTEIQELFVRTFDLDPDCALDLGWHLFGERYERGEWLSRLRGDLQQAGCETASELPDHLTNVLALIERADPSRAGQLARLVAPVLDRLEAALDQRDSPFRHLVVAVKELVVAAAYADAGAIDG